MDAVHGFRVAKNEVTSWKPDDALLVRSKSSFADDVEVQVHRHDGKRWWYTDLPTLTFHIGHREANLVLLNKVQGWFKGCGKGEQELGFAPEPKEVPAETVSA